MDIYKLKQLHAGIEGLGGESLCLPLPRRMSLSPVMAYRNALLGSLAEFVSECCEDQIAAAEFLGRSRANDAVNVLSAQFGFNEASIRTLYMVSRHQYHKAPIHTVSEGLEALLEDTKVRDNIPIRFFAPPARIAYMEFAAADRRKQSLRRVYAGGKNLILEGCYIQESFHKTLPQLAKEAREILELDPHMTTRIIDIGFTPSPLSTTPGSANESILLDTIDTIHLYIQDENEPFADVLRRHQDLNMHHAVIAHNGSGSTDLYAMVEDNLRHLSKILFYLTVEREERKVIHEQADLEKRLKGVANKKKSKIERMINRVYDRIVVGPKTYTPIKDRIAAQGLPQGTRSPHYRSGFFGIRWIGHGDQKMAELRRTKETFVNEYLLKGESASPRDYEIR